MSAPAGIEALVCQDISTRQQAGVAKYGTTVAQNPAPLSEWHQHAYEEALDFAIYLRRAMEHPGIEDARQLGLLADIRAAVGDPTGKLMQEDLLARCRHLAEIEARARDLVRVKGRHNTRLAFEALAAALQ